MVEVVEKELQVMHVGRRIIKDDVIKFEKENIV